MKPVPYHEKLQRGSINFPLAFYHVDFHHPRYEMPAHWHIEYEIIRILSGSFLISINGKSFTAAQGDCIFISSGNLHSAIPKDCIYECIVFDLNMLGKGSDDITPYIEKIQLGLIQMKEFYPSCDNFFHTVINLLFETMREEKDGYELIAKGCLLQLFGTLYQEQEYVQNISQSPSVHSRLYHLKRVFRFIEDHYSSTITLEMLAKEAGMSANHFCRYFKEMTTRSPMDYINYYRIEKACYFLQHSDLSITDIGFQCGFNDASYFSKIFKQYKELTPRQYFNILFLKK